MSRLGPTARAVIAIAGIAPPIGLAALGFMTPNQDGWRPGVVYLLAALTFLLISYPLAARVTRSGATVAGAAALGFLGWADPALTAVVAVPLMVGALANWRAAVGRTTGMSAIAAVLDQVGTGTAKLISAGHRERIRNDYLATVDRFHEVFSAQTRRVSTAAALAEIAFSPVTILAMALTAGAVLATPGADVLAFVLLGPVIGGCVATLTRNQPTSAPPPITTGPHVNIRTAVEHLRCMIIFGGDARKAAVAAIVTAVLQGVALALAITMVWALLDQHRLLRLPLFLLLAVAIAHILALRWSIGSARVAGIIVLRRLSHRITDQILMAPEGSLTGYEDQLSRLVTRDVVTISGLSVHALRPFASAGLTPVAAMLTMIVIEWQLTIPALFLLPLVVLAAFLLLKEPRRDLLSALAAINRVLAFLGASRNKSLPGVEK